MAADSYETNFHSESAALGFTFFWRTPEARIRVPLSIRLRSLTLDKLTKRNLWNTVFIFISLGNW